MNDPTEMAQTIMNSYYIEHATKDKHKSEQINKKKRASRRNKNCSKQNKLKQTKHINVEQKYVRWWDMD